MALTALTSHTCGSLNSPNQPHLRLPPCSRAQEGIYPSSVAAFCFSRRLCCRFLFCSCNQFFGLASGFFSLWTSLWFLGSIWPSSSLLNLFLVPTCSWLGSEPDSWLNLCGDEDLWLSHQPLPCPARLAGGASAFLVLVFLLPPCPFGSSWHCCALTEETGDEFGYLCQHIHELMGHELLKETPLWICLW